MPAASSPASSFGPSASRWSRSPMISSFGDRSLPVAHAGQTSWQRPHSVHETVSTICFQVMSVSVPAPIRISSSGTSGSSNRSGSSRPRARVLAEVDVDPGGDDVQVLRVGQVGQEREDDQHVRPHEDALGDLGAVAAAEQVRERVRHRRPAGRPLVQPQRDPRRVPQQQRGDDPGDHRQDQVGLAQMAAPEAVGPLHLADEERGRHAGQHEHREQVDQEREPSLLGQPGDRRVLVDRRRSSP